MLQNSLSVKFIITSDARITQKVSFLHAVEHQTETEKVRSLPSAWLFQNGLEGMCMRRNNIVGMKFRLLNCLLNCTHSLKSIFKDCSFLKGYLLRETKHLNKAWRPFKTSFIYCQRRESPVVPEQKLHTT